MNKWIAEFELEDGDTMPEHMDLEYKGAKIDFYCKPLEQEPCDDAISREELDKALYERFHEEDSPNNITDVPLGAVRNFIKDFPPVNPQKPKTDVLNKIIAEIEHVIDYTYDSSDYDKALYNGAYKDGLYEALDIIDKHKAESE